MEEFDDDDFGDLYADIEVQVSSAINAIQALTQLPPENEEIYDNDLENFDFREADEGVGDANAEALQEKVVVGEEEEEEEEEEGDEEENGNESENEGEGDGESESESESEDDLNIVLNNNDRDNSNINDNEKWMKIGFQSGRNGVAVANEVENGNDEENELSFGVENGGGSGERASGGKGDCNNGGYNSQYKYTRSHSAAFSSNLKGNGSAAGVASSSSPLVRGDWEDDGRTRRFGTSSIGVHSGHNFSLPRSRTILDVNIDALELKPWRHPGADITDFFNFGLDENSWKHYSNHLDQYREQTTKVAGNSAYMHARRSIDYEAGSEHEEIVHGAGTEIIPRSKQRTVSPANEVSHREQQSEMPKGRAIQVEDGIGERQPSTDIKYPIERDSDVIIHIPVQDMEEDCSNSDKVSFDETTKCLHEASGSGTVGAVDAGDMLSFSSGSEDELPILDRSTEETSKSVPDRCFRHTSACNCDPVCMDSDEYGRIQVSEADDKHQLTDCDSDGTTEAIKASDDAEKSAGWAKLTTAPSTKKSESSHSEQSQHSPSSSPSQNHHVASRGGAYAESDEFLDHPKKASPNSVSELRESVTFDYHSSKDSRSHGINTRSQDYKYFARSRSPVQRNLKFQNKTSARLSGLKSHQHDGSASPVSDAEKFYDVRHSPDKHRSREYAFDSYEKKDYSNYEESEYSFDCGGASFSDYQSGNAFSGYPRGKGRRNLGYERDQCESRNLSRKHQFLEQRIPRLKDEVIERNWHQYDRGLFVQEMDSLDYDGSGQLNSEQPPCLKNGNRTRWKRKADEPHFKRSMKNDDFLPERNYCIEFTLEKYRSLSYNERERDWIGNIYERQLPYARREVQSPVRSKRRYESPLNGCDTIWRTDCDDKRSRYTRNRLPFRSYKEPRSASRGRGRGRGRAAPFSRNGMFERHNRRRRQHYVERFRGSNKLDSYDDGFNNDENMEDPDDQDDFLRRRRYRQSELFHWPDEEYNSRNLEDNFQADGTSYTFDRAPRNKRYEVKHGSGRGGKLLDGTELDQRRYKLSRESNNCSQLFRSSSNVHKDKFEQTLPRCWDSTDSHMVVGDGKSSRCFKGGNLMYYGRYEYLNWNEELEQGTLKDFNGTRFEKLDQADGRKFDACQEDANWCEKFPDAKQNDSLEIEEGQIVTEDFDEKPTEKASALDGTSKIIDVKNLHSESMRDLNENPRIMEILAKMEKRRERFKQPITPNNVSEKNSNPCADMTTEIAETRPQRPARKRKWDGS